MSSEGFASAKAWVLKLAAKNDKKQIVLGLEPTGHYWFAVAILHGWFQMESALFR